MGTSARDIPFAFGSYRIWGPVLHGWLHLGSCHSHAQAGDAGTDGISSQGAVDAPEALASIGLTAGSTCGGLNVVGWGISKGWDGVAFTVTPRRTARPTDP